MLWIRKKQTPRTLRSGTGNGEGLGRRERIWLNRHGKRGGGKWNQRVTIHQKTGKKGFNNRCPCGCAPALELRLWGGQEVLITRRGKVGKVGDSERALILFRNYEGVVRGACVSVV